MGLDGLIAGCAGCNHKVRLRGCLKDQLIGKNGLSLRNRVCNGTLLGLHCDGSSGSAEGSSYKYRSLDLEIGSRKIVRDVLLRPISQHSGGPEGTGEIGIIQCNVTTLNEGR